MPSYPLYIALFTIALVGCNSTADIAEQDSTPDTNVPALNASTADAIVPVRGMSCPLCAENIQRQFSFDPRIAGSRVDLGSGNVYVDFAAGQTVPAQDLAKAIDTAGFTPGEVSFNETNGGGE